MNIRTNRTGLAPGFAVCAVTFALGCAAGIAASRFLPPDDALRDRLLSPQSADFWQNLWYGGRFCLAALIAAFTVFGALAAPGLTALRGFLMCFTMSGAVRVFGSAGVPLAVALVLPGAIVSVPCLFFVAAQSFSGSLTLASLAFGVSAQSKRPYGGSFMPRAVACLFALAVSAGAETLWAGRLVEWGIGIARQSLM